MPTSLERLAERELVAFDVQHAELAEPHGWLTGPPWTFAPLPLNSA
jgi:hypothetical protein